MMPKLLGRRRCRDPFWIMLALVGLAVVALTVGLALSTEPMSRWHAWQLRFGGGATRRAALAAIRASEARASFAGVRAAFDGDATAKSEAEAATRGQIRAQRLLPVLAEAAAHDPDPTCRASAVSAFDVLATLHGSPADRASALRLALGGCRDPAAEVRAAALASLASLAAADRAAVFSALHAGLADSDGTVRLAAVRGWASLGVLDPPSRRESAATLAEIPARSTEASLREAAAWSLGMVGDDSHRVGATDFDVAPSLVRALADPVARVRLAAATTLGQTTLDARTQPLSAWLGRRDQLVAPLRTALTDPDPLVRVRAGVALSWLGERDPALRALLDEAAVTGPSSSRAACQAALAIWPPAKPEPDPE